MKEYFTVGMQFERKDMPGELYLLAQTDSQKIQLISIRAGNRWNDNVMDSPSMKITKTNFRNNFGTKWKVVK